MTHEIVMKMSGTNILELCEHYRTAEQQGSLLIFSANLVAIPLLHDVKNIQAKKIFPNHPSNGPSNSVGVGEGGELSKLGKSMQK